MCKSKVRIKVNAWFMYGKKSGLSLISFIISVINIQGLF